MTSTPDHPRPARETAAGSPPRGAQNGRSGSSQSPSGTIRTPAPRLTETLPPSPPPVPTFPLRISPPDIHPWLDGNTGLRGVWTIPGHRPGPHVAITALMHGNEYAGAIVLCDLLRQSLIPERGTLSLIFLNPDAFLRFSPADPLRYRFVDQDMNRLWGPSPPHPASTETRRVAELTPYLHTIDQLLDLHSMLWPSPPLLLTHPGTAGTALATSLHTPSLVVQDPGHAAGLRLIDTPHFATPGRSACLLEAGQHWSRETLRITRNTVSRFLEATGITSPTSAEPPGPVREATVTDRITARSGRFVFFRNIPENCIIPHRGTCIAQDGPDEIRTPYDNCLLILPNYRPSRGQTAVRLARFLP